LEESIFLQKNVVELVEKYRLMKEHQRNVAKEMWPKKVGLIALEKRVPRTYRFFCHPASKMKKN